MIPTTHGRSANHATAAFWLALTVILLVPLARAEAASRNAHQVIALVKEHGVEGAVQRLATSDDPADQRLGRALASLVEYLGNEPEQLWFQLQARTRLPGWEEFQNQLLSEIPAETLLAHTSSLAGVRPAVIAAWNFDPGPLTHLAISSDRTKLYCGTVLGDFVALDTKTLKEAWRHPGVGKVIATAQGPEGKDYFVVRRGQIEVCDAATARPAGRLNSSLWRLKPQALPESLVLPRSLQTADLARATLSEGDSLVEQDAAALAQRALTGRHTDIVVCPLPSGEQLVIVQGGTKLRVVNASDGTDTYPAKSLVQLAEALAFFRDGSRLAVVGQRYSQLPGTIPSGQERPRLQRVLTVWDVLRGEEIASFEVANVQSIVAFLDHETFATGTADGQLHLWKTGEAAAIHSVQAQGSLIRRIVALDKRRVFTSDSKGVVRLVDLDAGKNMPPTLPSPGRPLRMTASQDGRWSVSLINRVIRVWDSATCQVLHTVDLDQIAEQVGAVGSIALDRQQGMLYVGGQDLVLRVTLSSGDVTARSLDRSQFPGPLAWPVRISPDARHVVAWEDKSLKVFDPQTGSLRHAIGAGVKLAEDYAFLSQERIAIAYQIDGETNAGVVVFDLRGGKEVARHEHGWLRSFAATRAGDVVIASGLEKSRRENRPTVIFWNPTSGEKVRIEAQQPSPAAIVRLSDDGERAVTAAGSIVSLWDVPQRKVLRRFNLGVEIAGIEFDGGLLAVTEKTTGTRHVFEYVRDPRQRPVLMEQPEVDSTAPIPATSKLKPHADPAPAPAVLVRFSLRGIDPPGGFQSSDGIDINNQGVVLARARRGWAGARTRAYLWQDGCIRELLTGKTETEGTRINNKGVVLGRTLTYPLCLPLRWDGAKLSLGSTISGQMADPKALNDSGLAFGRTGMRDRYQVFRWQGDALEPLAAPPGFDSASPWDVNEAGYLVGTSDRLGQDGAVHRPVVTHSQGWVWHDGVFRSPPAKIQGQQAPATSFRAINNQGKIAGERGGHAGIACWSIDDLANPSLFRSPLGERSACLVASMNDDGWVVGSATPTAAGGYPSPRAALWSPAGQPYDLNQCLDESGRGWLLIEAKAINSRGQIVGSARDPRGQERGFLLAPIAGPLVTEGPASPPMENAAKPPAAPLAWSFPTLDDLVQKNGIDAAIRCAEESAKQSGDRRLIAALAAAAPAVRNDPQQLWFQLAARTRLVGYEDIREHLAAQAPGETLVPLGPSLDQALPPALGAWQFAGGPITYLAASSDGKKVYCGTRAGELAVIDVETLEIVRRFPNVGFVTQTEHDGKRQFLARRGGFAVCDLETGKELKAAAPGHDAGMALFDVHGGQGAPVFGVVPLERNKRTQSFARVDEGMIVTGDMEGWVSLWNGRFLPAAEWRAHDADVWRTVVAGQKAFTSDAAGFLKVLDLKRAYAPVSLQPSAAYRIGTWRSPDRKWSGTFSGGQLIEIWASASGELRQRIDLGEAGQQIPWTESLGVDLDRQEVWLGGPELVARFDLATGQSELIQLDTSKLPAPATDRQLVPFLGAYVSPGGRHAVVWSRTHLAVFDNRSGAQSKLILAGENRFGDDWLFLDDDHFALEFIGDQSGVRVFNLRAGEETGTYQHGTAKTRVAYAHDAKTLITLGSQADPYWERQSLAVWPAGGRPPRFLAAPRDAGLLMDVAASPDGKRAVTVTAEGVIHVWDIPGGRATGRFDLNVPAASIDFDGKTVVVRESYDGQVHAFEWRRVSSVAANHEALTSQSQAAVDTFRPQIAATELLNRRNRHRASPYDFARKLWMPFSGQSFLAQPRRIAPVVVNRELTAELLVQLAEHASAQCWSQDRTRCYALVPGELLEIDPSKQMVLRSLPLGNEPPVLPRHLITWTSRGLLVTRLTEAFLIDPESMSITCQFELRGTQWLAGCRASPLVCVVSPPHNGMENVGLLRVDRLEVVASLSAAALRETIKKETGEQVAVTFERLTMTPDGKHVLLPADESGRQVRLSVSNAGFVWEKP